MFFYDRELTFARPQERFPKFMQITLLGSAMVLGLASYGSSSSLGESWKDKGTGTMSRFAFAPQDFGRYLHRKAEARLRVINRAADGRVIRPVQAPRHRSVSDRYDNEQSTGLVPIVATPNETAPLLGEDAGGFAIEKPKEREHVDRSRSQRHGGRAKVVSIGPEAATSSWQAREAPVRRSAAPVRSNATRSRLFPKAGRARRNTVRGGLSEVRAKALARRSRSASTPSGLPAWANAALFRSQ